jgi:diguanylate cyclase (GGDEF)-like protein
LATTSFLTAPLREPSGLAELRRAQFTMLSRMIPLLYAVITLNALGLSYTFLGQAPSWLVMFVPSGLLLLSCVRFILWWRGSAVAYTDRQLAQMLRLANGLGPVLTVAFTAWAFALFPYGNQFAQGQVAFCVAVTVLSTIFALIHLLPVALLMGYVVGIAFVGFFSLSKNEHLITIAVTFCPILVAAMVIVTIQNRDFTRMINAQTRARREREAQSRFLRMIDSMPMAVMIADPATSRITYCNDASRKLIAQLEEFLPVKASDLVGTSIDVFRGHPDRGPWALSDPQRLPFNSRLTLGEEIVDIKVSAVTGSDGSYISVMLTLAIVTSQVEAENRIQHLAYYDALTELPNRATFNDDLSRRLARPDSNRASLLLIDLDGFKPINDTRGHGIGDTLLRLVADRLRTVAHEPGTSLARIGGDEFAILKGGDDPQAAIALAKRITDILSEPYDILRGTARIGASVGIALAPDHGTIADALLTRVDIALYAAKAAGKGVAKIFTPAMEAQLQAHVILESQLREALKDKRGLYVLYQPIVSIETGKVTAREALIRWNHPDRGPVSPEEFIPVAEQSGFMDALGEFVLKTACRDAAAWPDNARVAVNVSANQLGKGILVPLIVSTLDATGLSPNRLEIEVTETAVLKEEREVIEDLKAVRALGVRVALDDFGTGFSSLTHLRVFPFDKIKIDGSFVREAVERPDCAAIIHVVADLGKRLGVTTVAEGVETQAQFDCIRKEGCAQVQGYLFGRPSPHRLISLAME